MNAPNSWARRNSLSRENLARFRWHTGAEPRPVRPDEPVPVLFRDIGPEAMARLLREGLRRLAGPMTPITYLRTVDYQEPYVDYAAIGRLVLLRPEEIDPWHSGVPHVFIAEASRIPPPGSYGFVPGAIPLARAARLLAGAKNVQDLREAFGGSDYDKAQRDTRLALDQLILECRNLEALALPLRITFQTGRPGDRSRLAEQLGQFGLSETDLCAAWHHLSAERRAIVKAALPEIALTRRKDN